MALRKSSLANDESLAVALGLRGSVKTSKNSEQGGVPERATRA